MGKPRRKKKYLLLRGKMGNFIVVDRSWYDRMGIGKHRGDRQMWVIAYQNDDRAVLEAMGQLTDRLVKQTVTMEGD